MAAAATFVGRQEQLSQATAYLHQGQSLLIRGRDGIGKRRFLKALYEQQSPERLCLWLADTRGKQAVFELLQQLHRQLSLKIPERFIPQRYRALVYRQGVVRWSWVQRTLVRAALRELMEILIDSLPQQPKVQLFIESLELPPTLADLVHQLAGVTQLISVITDSNRRHRITQLIPTFSTQITLARLSRPDTLLLIDQMLEQHSPHFVSASLRRQFSKAVAQDSEGVPAAVIGMIEQARQDGEVTPVKLRSYRHEASVRYLDMTPVFMLLLVGFMAMRYISRGMSESELYIVSGVATTLFYAMVLLMRKLKY